jgi:hypothetical protein
VTQIPEGAGLLQQESHGTDSYEPCYLYPRQSCSAEVMALNLRSSATVQREFSIVTSASISFIMCMAVSPLSRYSSRCNQGYCLTTKYQSATAGGN